MRQKLQNPNISSDAKYAFIKKIAGGVCSRCEGTSTKILSFDVEGAQLIEKYCDECFKKWDELSKGKHSAS